VFSALENEKKTKWLSVAAAAATAAVKSVTHNTEVTTATVVVVVCVFVCIPGASLNETTTTKPTH